MRGKTVPREVTPYVLSQVVGACSAAVIVWIMTGQTFAPALGESVDTIAALPVEILYTFAPAPGDTQCRHSASQ